MIFGTLEGGLGNQMFQYAFALSFSLKKKSRLVLDLSELEKDKKRTFALNQFQINVLTINESPNLLSKYKKLKFGIFNEIKTLKEKKEFKFDETVFQIEGNIRIQGYWQCPTYFDFIQYELLKKFQLKTQSKGFLEWNKKITEVNSASIHIRRGDYATDQLTNDVHGVCSIDYYLNAIKRIKEICKDVVFFVFSDDIDWCKMHLSDLGNGVIVERLTDAEELILMSNCKHNIIANSSFSWWGAYLNTNKNKIVISPKKWFNKVDINTEELIPKTWHRI